MFYFNRFDICEAYYCFACDYHSGQGSKEYAIFGRLDKLGFKPSPNLLLGSLSENSAEIYMSLVEKSLSKG